MRALFLLFFLCVATLLLAAGCAKPGSAGIDAAPGPAPARMTRAYGAAAEFDDAGAGLPETEMLVASARAKAAAPLADEPVSTAPDALPREVVYTAALRIVVVSTDDAIRTVQALAEQAGGHLQQSTAHSITVRVPAAKFHDTVDRIASLGEVVDRSIDASDVTEQMLDLNIRLDNAKKTRERLIEHLARSQKISDTLKIEQELSRVSETIEQLEGRLRFMRSQVAMSTITVVFTARTPAQPSTASPLGVPFSWIEELGDGLVAGSVERATREPHLFDFGPKFEPPAEFIRYYSSRTRVEALSADDLRIKIRRHENHDRGALAFWQKLARETLVRTRAVAIREERGLDDDLALIRGTREIGGQRLGYLLVLKRTPRHVYSFEVWGPETAFDERLDALVTSARTMRR